MKYLFAIIAIIYLFAIIVLMVTLFNLVDEDVVPIETESVELVEVIDTDELVELLEGRVYVTVLKVYENNEYKILVNKNGKEGVMIIQIKNQ